MAKISKVWMHFDKINKLTAKCKICGKICPTAGNTSNLHSHLNNVHKNKTVTSRLKTDNLVNIVDENNADDTGSISSSASTLIFNESISVASGSNKTSTNDFSVKMTQPSIEKAMNYVTSMKVGGVKNTEITEVLIYYICKDSVPFSTVDGTGFKYFLKVACPLYVVPSRNTIKNKLDEKYNLTSDIWTDIQMKSYLGVTIHFLENNTLVSGTLGAYELDKYHTSEYISQMFEEVIFEWGLNKSQIIAIVTDSGANIKKAAKDTFGTRKWIPCFAHTINLIANYSIDNCANLNELVEKVRSIVKYVKNSVNVSDELRQYQANDGIPEGNMLKMILDVKTRWNSLYYMVDRFLNLFKIISNILLEKQKAPDCLNTREVNTLKEVKHLLQPLEDLTKKISGDKYPTISCMLPLIKCVTSAINQITPTSTVGISLRSNILGQIHKHFNVLELFNVPISTILDPRFKNLHFQDPENCQKTIGKIKKLLLAIQNEQFVEIGPNTSSELSTSNNKSFDLWSYHTIIASLQIEYRTLPLNDYLIKPVVPINTNPFEAWDVIKSMHPNLFEITREKLSIVATSVPSERLFSKTGQILNKKRNRLTGKRLNKLVFMSFLREKDWFSIK
ncbi:zinc finger BED domain-containing protein 4-like [Aphis craccivora]|uniref:Zinc finger BED domain-containing protein 4-like n=1 Tax=Aphis craccivora TaxID=307492 RepID=A0A6G0VXU2_APHCR|nr:zinc finger BED domain-containing protein 4-like [Aphis craccivora]